MSPKRVLIVKGSPRKRGNSVLLAEQVAVAARAAGASVTSPFSALLAYNYYESVIFLKPAEVIVVMDPHCTLDEA